MLGFPNVKINIGLNIIRKRDDGYHDLESLFYPAGLCDMLEFVEDPDPQQSGPAGFCNTGIILPGPVEKNLCIRALELVRKRYPVPPVKVHLHKVIPPGSGLGGGSSDAACMIKMLDREWNLGITVPGMEKLALALGSDCPFFIRNQPAFVSGRGDRLFPGKVVLRDYHLVIVCPGIPVDTATMYSRITPCTPEVPLSRLIRRPVEEWKDHIRNDFEDIVFRDHPVIGDIKDALYKAGALFSLMSGSGSAVYGIFREAVGADRLFPGSFVWEQIL